MRFNLKAGTSVDLLSPHEFSSGVKDLKQAIKSGVPKDYFQQSLSIPSGTGEAVLYECPLGSNVEMHRLAISGNGYTASNPLQTGDVMFWLNGNSLVNFLPQNGVVAPVVFFEGTGAIVIHGGEALTVSYENLTDNLSVFIQFRR